MALVLLLASTGYGQDGPDSAPTFCKDVAPLLFAHCATCHRPGEIGPFALLTYQDAKKRAGQIAQLAARRIMPPYKPLGEHGQFIEERRLTDRQIALLNQWAEHGAPEGDPKDLPPAPKFPVGWKLGEPDLVLKMSKPFVIPAEGADLYWHFVFPLDLKDTKYLRGIEVRPGNLRVAHHATGMLDTSGTARRLEKKHGGQGYPGLNPGFFPTYTPGYVPGQTPRFFREDTAIKLPKGADFVLQMHYHPNGKEDTDQTVVGLYFTDKKPERHGGGALLGSLYFEVPPGEKAFKVTDSFTLPVGAEVRSIWAHMHMIGKEVRAWAELPDGKRKSLLEINDWDFNWQESYSYSQPFRLPRGTVIKAEFVFDNSADNPRNPNNPPKLVRYGDSTTDEMAGLVIGGVVDNGLEALVFGGTVLGHYLEGKKKADKAREEAAKAEKIEAAPTVRIESGQVSGATLGEQKDVHVYKGIPFAAPPVGDLRWKPPQPVKAWDGVRVCTDFGPACPQPKALFISNDITNTNEDCLHLNVWAPAQRASKPAPVMVWIHGGAFTLGAASQKWFDGESLARKGVVLVTINYRVGPFGFLAHPLLSRESEQGVSGNYGLLDQIFALRWVKTNIAAFGGDPGCVTIFGESAGAASVCHLLVSPLSKELFQRAIAESGGARDPIRHLREKWYGKEPMEDVGRFFETALGCDKADNPLAAMRAKSAEEILNAAKSAKSHFGEETSAPIVDGWVQPDDPNVLFEEGKAHDVPFIAGSNAHEVGSLISWLALRKDWREQTDSILELFPEEARKRAATVTIFTSVARADARAMSRHKSKAYLYQFSRAAPALRFLGAFHSLEIIYVFGNLDPKLRFEEQDRELSATMSAYWAQFAKTGDPNGKDLPHWPAYDARTDEHMEFGDVAEVGRGLEKAACDGIDRLRADRLKTRNGPD